MLPLMTDRWTGRSPFWTLDRLMSDLLQAPGPGTSAGSPFGRNNVWSFPADVLETDTEFRFMFEVPGFRLDDLEVTVENHVLRITGERTHPYGPEEQGEDERGLRQAERRYGRFERALALPAGVDIERVSASCADGILTVTVPKTETARPRRIEIGSGIDSGRIAEKATA